MSRPVTGIAGEGQETAQKAKYPYTFGPIVTSAAIPIATAKINKFLLDDICATLLF
jgi:hypothetical protein